MKKLQAFLAALILFTTTNLYAQNGASFSELQQKLASLAETRRVLYIAAHPDDENTRLLAYLAKERKYTTAYLSLTRGDGGQNLIGGEQGVPLGLIRTQELLAARKLDGAQQFFTRAFDFGFSKTTQESIQFWGEENILYDVVWAIRKFQPDVIITRFPPDARAGHGHHSASAVLANQAFEAAADASKFPQQFSLGVKPWKATRLLWNTFNFGTTNTTSENQLQLNVSNYNAVLGKSYGELAAESRSMHKSQGFGVPAQRGLLKEYFLPVAGDTAIGDIMYNVPNKWEAFSGIQKRINKALQNFQVNNYEPTVRELVTLREQLQKLPKQVWIQEKIQTINELLLPLAGIFVDAFTTQATFTQGDSIAVNVQALQRLSNGSQVRLQRVQVAGGETLIATDTLLPLHTIWQQKFRLLVQLQNSTQPYWLQRSKQLGYFEVPTLNQIGLAWNSPAFEIAFTMLVGMDTLRVSVPITYKHTDAIRGELYDPINVQDRVLAKFTKANFVQTPTQKQAVALQLKGKFLSGDAVFINGVKVFTSSNTGLLDTLLELGNTNKWSSEKKLTATLNGQPLFSEQTISYNHIPPITFYTLAQANYVELPVQKTGDVVGYIAGAGDEVPEALEALGYRVVLLTKENLSPETLKPLQAVVTGVRAYNIHSFLQEKYAVLMNYVKEGGNLIVQYNTNSQIGPVKANISPYPLQIGRVRVTEENSKVSMVEKNHPVLNSPNPITSSDFDGWVQERSVYQAENLDARYRTPLAMNDENEKSSSGSLAIAAFGKGNFVYTALVLFRQLPAGVPGSYKLLANMVSLPQN